MSDEAVPFALVIGGASGIGAALTDAYRAQGMTAVTWDIEGRHDVTCDVREPDAIDDAVGLTRMRWGIPTAVTVTAGVGHSGLLTDAEPDEFDHVMRVNARGPWLCMRAWVGAMQEQQVAGSFVAVSSISARLVDRTMGIYCASKAALSMLVRVAAAEWGPLGIRVERHRSWRDAYADARAGAGARPSRARRGWPASPGARRWDGSANQRTSPSRSSPCTPWSGSRGRCSSATAVCRYRARSFPELIRIRGSSTRRPESRWCG